ncbi:hypothetical protein MMC13_006696 [Lambiella insularis]|nr:hypothetical protein [Lambiella insularis]
MQEDLAKMFDQRLNFSHVQPQQSEEPAPVIYSISQHYHHSAHLVNDDQAERFQVERTVPVPESDEARNERLLKYGINFWSLSPSQRVLFQRALPDQQSRLIELWRISPLNHNNFVPANESGNWQQTTLQHEEDMARLHYEQRSAQADTPEAHEETDQKMVGHETSLTLGSGDHHSIEPYIKSGYEVLAERDYNQEANSDSYTSGKSFSHGLAHEDNYTQAVDPAFQSKGWWEVYSKQPMEHQYGMFDQMNQFRAPPQTAVGSKDQEDEEMLEV